MYDTDFFLPGTMLRVYLDPSHFLSAMLNPTFHGQAQEDRTVSISTHWKEKGVM